MQAGYVERMGPSPNSRVSTGMPVRAATSSHAATRASWGASSSRSSPAMTKVQDTSAANSTLSLPTWGWAPQHSGLAGSVR